MYTLAGLPPPGSDPGQYMDPGIKNSDLFMFALVGALGWYYFLGGKKKLRKAK